MITIPDRDWRQLAACRHTDPELFFPVSASGPSLDQITQAKAICTRCPSAGNAWPSRWTPGRTTAYGEARPSKSAAHGQRNTYQDLTPRARQ